MYKLDLEKADEPDIKLPTLLDHRKSKKIQKRSASLTMLQPLCVSQQAVEKRWEYQTSWPASWETCVQVKKQQLEPDMDQWT